MNPPTGKLHLSNVVIDPVGALRVTGEHVDLHALHRLLWRAFPDTPQSERPFLFRADIVRVEGRMEIRTLIASSRLAQWGQLGDAVVRVGKGESERSTLLDKRSTHRFFLRANPTVTRKGLKETGMAALDREAFLAARGKRHAVRGDESRAEWLERKALGAGFRVLEFRTSNVRPYHWRAGTRRGTHEGADFEGVLEIREPERFAHSLETGIGSAKAFGFGLLSVVLARP